MCILWKVEIFMFEEQEATRVFRVTCISGSYTVTLKMKISSEVSVETDLFKRAVRKFTLGS